MLQFDRTNFGAAINISADGLTAKRNNGFANGIVFTDRPLNVFEKVTFEIQQQNILIWQGALRLGVFVGHQIPMGDLPLSTMDPQISSLFSMVSLEKLIHLSNGMRITVWLTESQSLNYAINNLLCGTLIEHQQNQENLTSFLPVRLVFDIFGNTNRVQLIREDDTVPFEIKARGPDAIRQFQTACDTGTTSVRRTLLLMIGPKSSGKTRLKELLLTDWKFDDNENNHIDLSSSCSVQIDPTHQWSLRKSCSQHQLTRQSLTAMVKDFAADDHDRSKTNLQQQEYETQLAHNIILNLLKRRYEFHTGNDKKDKSWKETLMDDLKLVYPSSIVPISIRSLIERQLAQMKSSDPHAVLSTMNNNNNTTINTTKVDSTQDNQRLRLDVWDLPGTCSFADLTHQIFLSPRAIYLLVFDMTKDLHQPSEWNKELTNLEHLNFLMHSIYCYSGSVNRGQSFDDETNEARFSPPIILVGTHRNQFPNSTKKMTIDSKISTIQAMISRKPYSKHVVEQIFVLDTLSTDVEDFQQIDRLKQTIEEVALNEPYMGEQIPTRWLRFENDLNRLKKQQDSFYASLDQICDIARTQDICSSDELKTLLDFYHDLGVIVYFGNTQDMFLKNTLILRPQILIQLIQRLVYQDEIESDIEDGLIDERMFEQLCQPFIEQKQSLLALFKRFDLLCERLNPSTNSTNCKQYYVPGRIRRAQTEKSIHDKEEPSVTFYYVFDGYFPESLFHQVLVRTIKWTQTNVYPSAKVQYRRAKFVIDDQNVLILSASSMKYARMKVQIIRTNPSVNGNAVIPQTASTTNNATNVNRDEQNLQLPEPILVAKVRKFFESMLNDIKSTWIRRLTFQCMIVCPCGKICDLHKTPFCSNNACLHFLNLDHSLSNPIVECSFRRVQTNQYRNWFPKLGTTRAVPIIDILYDQKSMNHFFEDSNLPNWIRSTAKLLSTSELHLNISKASTENRTWIILAKKLGYQQSVIDQFSLSRNPSLQLITDWIVRTGNSSLSVDMLLATVKQIGRDDLVEIIAREREAQYPSPSVFISYQWDTQDEVKELRNYLELVGFTCWMDMGQIGGGELLYEKIDHGIRNAKVVLCCITPMFLASTLCQRELILADMLKKPIIPVMFEMTAWPPIGAASLILTPLTYVDLKGAGGHGGSGKHADLQARYNEIASIIARHTTSTSPSTFRRLVHSSSVDQRVLTARAGSAMANLNSNQRTNKQVRNRRQQNIDSIHSNDRSISSLSEDELDEDEDEFSETSEHNQRPIEPILTATNVNHPVVPTTLNQPFQIRSSVHLEHRLGAMTISQQPETVSNRVANCAVCCIL